MLKVIRLDNYKQFIYGGAGEKPEKVLVITSPKDLTKLVQSAGPMKPLPPHINPHRPEWLGPEIGKILWGRPDESIRQPDHYQNQ